MTDREQGVCLCGAIRYEVDRAEVLSGQSCYCKDCQKVTGGGYTAYVTIPEDKFTVTNGELKSFESQGTAGSTSCRQFCGDCGSPIVSTTEMAPGLVFVKAGSFDDFDWISINNGYWRSSARAWALPDGSYPVCETNI